MLNQGLPYIGLQHIVTPLKEEEKSGNALEVKAKSDLAQEKVWLLLRTLCFCRSFRT